MKGIVIKLNFKLVKYKISAIKCTLTKSEKAFKQLLTQYSAGEEMHSISLLRVLKKNSVIVIAPLARDSKNQMLLAKC